MFDLRPVVFEGPVFLKLGAVVQIVAFLARARLGFGEREAHQFAFDFASIGQFGFGGYLGPLGKSIYLVPGLTASHDSGKDLTTAGAYLNLHFMLPAGDRFIPFIECGLVGAAIRLDLIDRTAGGPAPTSERTTYIRGGFQIGGGLDLALGGNWSVIAEVRGVFLGDVNTQLVNRGDRVVNLEEDPSYWELPRLAIVYWY